MSNQLLKNKLTAKVARGKIHNLAKLMQRYHRHPSQRYAYEIGSAQQDLYNFASMCDEDTVGRLMSFAEAIDRFVEKYIPL